MAEPLNCDAELDATGLLCPLPVLRANRALKGLPIGARLKVRASDPAAKSDFPAYCRTTGHLLEWTGEHDGEFIFVVRKAGMAGSADA